MHIERPAVMSFYNQAITIIGQDLQVGQMAPEFSAHAPDWTTVQPLVKTKGKVRIIGSLPSLNSSVCDRETRRFNQEAAALSEDISILMVSMDLPWTLRQWCGAAGIDRVLTFSDHKTAEFGEHYAVLMKEPRILRRAVFVTNREGRLVYVAYMPNLGDEPNYAEVLDAARQALMDQGEA